MFVVKLVFAPGEPKAGAYLSEAPLSFSTLG